MPGRVPLAFVVSVHEYKAPRQTMEGRKIGDWKSVIRRDLTLYTDPISGVPLWVLLPLGSLQRVQSILMHFALAKPDLDFPTKQSHPCWVTELVKIELIFRLWLGS